MYKTPISYRDLETILEQEQQEYDFARVVNPYTCTTLELSEGEAKSLAACHAIWDHDHRCSNCFSRRACIQGKILYKTEVHGGNTFRIKASPYRVISEDGEFKNLVIESIRILDLEKEAVNTRINKNLESSLTNYVFNEAVTGVIHLDQDRRILFANNQAKKMILRGGEQEAFLLSTIVTNWIEGHQESGNPSLLFTQRYEYDHEDFFFDVQLIPFENGKKNELFLILHEHSSQEADLLAKVQDQDRLTGLYNKEGFQRVMRRILADHPKREYLHLRMNVKNFSLVNSVLGVQTGDALLVRIASLFKNMTEENGCACRFYSDQFGALLEKRYFDRQRLNLELNQIKDDADSQSLGLTFQMGIYEIDDTSLDPETICNKASIALKHVQDLGDLTGCSVYTDEMMEEDLLDNQLVTRFEQAIARDEFQIYLQPQINKAGSLLGAEVLVRWVRPDGEIVPPDSFIPLFEKNGMISRLDRVVWEKTTRQLAAWKDTIFQDICLSVNLSPVDITQVDIVDYLEKLTAQYDVDPGKLNLEITESCSLSNMDKLLRIIDKLHRRGFHIEIDDFGSGYSSLNMLKDLKADVLKIDRHFLEHTIHERRAKTILASIIQLASALDMDVITEGVETKEMVEMLSDIGCELFQGFYFSRPIPVEEFMRKYEAMLTK